jgi:hypothetical protein
VFGYVCRENCTPVESTAAETGAEHLSRGKAFVTQSPISPFVSKWRIDATVTAQSPTDRAWLVPQRTHFPSAVTLGLGPCLAGACDARGPDRLWTHE